MFRDGLAHAAEALGLTWQEADWDDPTLDQKIAAFQPELVFVVHGRRFAARWGALAQRYRAAVWLLDEPYEVDDTSRFSNIFEAVFVNDPGTLDRHRNARYLPVCYDAGVHYYHPAGNRPHAVGFVGGSNPWREEALTRLARKGLLSYVVGGPWHDPTLNGLCLSPNISAEATADLYRRTRIVVNLFRSRHHFNARRIPATSLNPRIYEALACGALVISERRPELATLCPEVPAFETLDELEFQVERHLQNADLFAEARKASIRRLAAHTYDQRVASALSALWGPPGVTVPVDVGVPQGPPAAPAVDLPMEAGNLAPEIELSVEWKAHPECFRAESASVIALHCPANGGPGSERGLVGLASHGNLALEFEVHLRHDTEFVAKIHQPEADNQLADSYHLLSNGGRAYLARHDHIFRRLTFPENCCISLAFSYHDGTLIVRKNGVELARVSDGRLQNGYCFLGVKAGEARLRNIRIVPTPAAGKNIVTKPSPQVELISRRTRATTPSVSIITTVYDRLDCLERCLQSTEALNLRDYEQIVVADSPPPPVLEQIAKLSAQWTRPELTIATLKTRSNDWGIAPAAAGLAMARGRYVSFLSDDNGYLPTHFDRLLETLENDPSLGFAYSSCLYDGRLTLSGSPPRPGRIDLGQPLFRRELFDRYLHGTLPFHEFGWDWRMIECFLGHGVRWRHIDEATFIFRLARYPHLISQRPDGSR